MAGLHGATVAPLPERIDALNYSLDSWERTDAAPQGWVTHLRQAMVPIQGCIQIGDCKNTQGLPVYRS